MKSSNKGPRRARINFESTTDLLDVPPLSDMLDGMTLIDSCPPPTSIQLLPKVHEDVNRRFSSVLIDKDEEFITKENKLFDYEDVSRYRILATGQRTSGALTILRTKHPDASVLTGTRAKRRSFYKWSVHKSPRHLVAIQLPCYSTSSKKRIPVASFTKHTSTSTIIQIDAKK